MKHSTIRLQKYLSQAGVASRRKAEELIARGLVRVDGRVVTTPGVTVDPETASVEVNGLPVQSEKKIYILLHKPAGYLCALKDRFGRPLVTDLVRDIPQRTYHVGRLDLDSEGLLFLTNDGDFAQRLTHPRHQVEKTYRLKLRGPLDNREAEMLINGLRLDDGFQTAPARVKILARDRRRIEISIREGKKRQVKRMLKAVGNEVIYLKRVAIGPLKLGRLKKGKWRGLKPGEISILKSAARKDNKTTKAPKKTKV